MWILSHVGLQGNEIAYNAATCRLHKSHTTTIKPQSQSYLITCLEDALRNIQKTALISHTGISNVVPNLPSNQCQDVKLSPFTDSESFTFATGRPNFESHGTVNTVLTSSKSLSITFLTAQCPTGYDRISSRIFLVQKRRLGQLFSYTKILLDSEAVITLSPFPLSQIYSQQLFYIIMVSYILLYFYIYSNYVVNYDFELNCIC